MKNELAQRLAAARKALLKLQKELLKIHWSNKSPELTAALNELKLLLRK